VAWTALAIVTALVAADDGQSMWLFAAALVAYFALLTKVMRPLLRIGLSSQWFRRAGPGAGALLLLVAVTLSAAATTALGLHPVFGAFAVGVIAPREAGEASRLLTTAGVVLVPTYFILTGLSFDIRTLGADGLVVLAVVLVVATASKVGSAMWATRRAGMERRDALALGLLLNTRGLTELVVLDIGLKAGIIDTRLFTVLVLFALITTAATMPLVPLALTQRSRRVEVKAAVGEQPAARAAPVPQFQRVPELAPEDVAALGESAWERLEAGRVRAG
jgi:Kef-type K+ transport system membrane component KefB